MRYVSQLLLSHAHSCTHPRPNTRGDLPVGTVVSRRHEHEHVLMFSHKLVHALVLLIFVFHAIVPVGLEPFLMGFEIVLRKSTSCDSVCKTVAFACQSSD
jgi:hypothetical protein